MKKNIRIVSTLLAILMMLGSFSVLFITTASAATFSEAEKAVASIYLKDNVYTNPEDKLNSMTKMMEKYGYEFYVDNVSGEVAMKEKATGNILFSNPYDVASSTGSNLFKNGSTGTKEQLLMSQIIITYTQNGVTKYLYSFQDAAMRGQISVSKIKNGVRVEYIIGQEAFRKLVPRWIPADSFETLIKAPLDKALEDKAIGQHKYAQFMSYFVLKDPSQETVASVRETMIKTYPICEKIPIYVCDDSQATAKILNDLESVIKTYCSDTYSFEQMDADHEITGYQSEDESYPVFKMALEYSLNSMGLEVKLACSGLQYDVTSYTLEDISILPYMGAGNTKNPGYNFYPDGAGSLFDFNLGKQTTIRGKIYGTDYAYHEVTGTYQKSIRFPVYGTIANEVIYTYSYKQYNDDGTLKGTFQDVRVSNTVKTKAEIEAFLAEKNIEQIPNTGDGTTIQISENSYQRGYVAIIESGESLGEIETYFAGDLSNYATMSNHFNPKPKDSYDIADSISVTSSSTWTVVSNRKYTGTIKIQYQLLSDEKRGQAAQVADPSFVYYDATWLGMAEAYRSYLINKGKLQKLDSEQVENDIPLYIESFGTLETQQTIATIPVNVMTPLTTFENVWTMYEELSQNGAKNINFKLTGFANGGMTSKIPSSLKWESSVGGKSGFKDLIEKSQEVETKDDGSHLGLFPDFDFAYSSQNTAFDGLNLKKDAVRTIDNRYTSKRLYSATQQKYVSFFQLAISPSRYSKFYEKLIKNLDKYDFNTISVSTLGNTLNSDFDEDDPFNREDNKAYTVDAFADLQKAGYSLMTDSGNAYTWAYVDHILNLDLDSSRYVKASASVPFLGAVLHGYIQFAGSPINEEGDINYAMLKAVENGAGMYFVLSYQNTQELKEDVLLSQYYSIRYDIWKDDVVSYYNTLNNLLKDVQTKTIIDHKFLNYNNTDANGNKYLTERVLDVDELQAAIREEMAKAEERARQQLIDEEIGRIVTVADARLALERANKVLGDMIDEMNLLNEKMTSNLDALDAIIAGGTEELTADAVNQAKSLAVAIWKTYEQAEYQVVLMDQTLLALANAKEIVREAKQADPTTLYQYTRAQECYTAAQSLVNNAKVAQTSFYTTTFADSTPQTAPATKLTAKINELKTLVDTYNSGKEEADQIGFNLTIDIVKEEGKFTIPQDSTGTPVTDEQELSRYAVNNNRVVAVTYGDVNETNHSKVAYKTFLLNYNNFAVSVTYNNVIYTIDRCGYIVIYN